MEGGLSQPSVAGYDRIGGSPLQSLRSQILSVGTMEELSVPPCSYNAVLGKGVTGIGNCVSIPRSNGALRSVNVVPGIGTPRIGAGHPRSGAAVLRNGAEMMARLTGTSTRISKTSAAENVIFATQIGASVSPQETVRAISVTSAMRMEISSSLVNVVLEMSSGLSAAGAHRQFPP